jgi:signal transduction histidine kinase
MIKSINTILMKSFFLSFLFFLNITFGSAQQTCLDSLKHQVSLAKNQDTTRVLALFSLADYYGFVQFDSCLFYSAQTLELSKKLNYLYGKFLGYLSTFHGLNSQANYTMALDAALNEQKTAEELKNDKLVSWAYYPLGLLYSETGDYSNGVTQFQKEIQLLKKIDGPMTDVFSAFSQLGIAYLRMRQLDSALWYAQKGYDLGLQSGKWKLYFPLAIAALGNVYMASGDYKLAENYFREAVNESRKSDNLYFEVKNYNNLATLYEKLKLNDSCIYYAMLSLQMCNRQNFVQSTLDVSKILTKVYESEGKKDSAIKYMHIMINANDSVSSLSKGRQFQQAVFKDIQRQQEINAANERSWFYILIAIAFSSVIYIIFRYRFMQKIKLLKMRNSISQDLHDEIGASLSGISLLSQMAAEKLYNNKNEEATDYLLKVKNNAHDVIEKLSDMVWIFNPQNDSIEKLLQRLRSFAISIAMSKNIKMHFATDKESEIKNLSIGQRKALYLISKEAINNSLKYAACSNIYYRLNANGSKWQLQIKDDGGGFIPSEYKNGNGLKNMQARADEIGANFFIQSQTGKGTIITVET